MCSSFPFKAELYFLTFDAECELKKTKRQCVVTSSLFLKFRNLFSFSKLPFPIQSVNLEKTKRLRLIKNWCLYTCWQVHNQSAHFYSVDITDKEAKMGFVCRVHSTARNIFKVCC
jgi:hypothetical protein